eukprot:gene25761-30936_t
MVWPVMFFQSDRASASCVFTTDPAIALFQTAQFRDCHSLVRWEQEHATARHTQCKTVG